MRWGKAIEILETLPGEMIARIVLQNATAPTLTWLVDANAVTHFVSYYNVVRPLLDTDNGRDIESFIAFCGENGHTKYPEYQVTLPEIRNYHRFTVAQLDRLVVNKQAAATNRAKATPCSTCRSCCSRPSITTPRSIETST